MTAPRPTPSAEEPEPRPATHVVVVGGGPGGYEAALVARRSGARVTLVERTGLGGAAVLTDAVPSKTLIATAEWMTIADRAPELGIRTAGFPMDGPAHRHQVDFTKVNERVLELAHAQSVDIRARLENEGVTVLVGTGRLEGTERVVVEPHVRAEPDTADPHEDPAAVTEPVTLQADIILIATGATPRVLPEAQPDGERILTWTQVYGLTELPTRLVVVGSGVTGAEFAGAYTSLGVDVVLVSSRDHVLPGEDDDAAEVIEEVFRDRGMTVLSQTRAEAVTRTHDGVEVRLADGRVVTGSHCLLAVGSVPSTGGLGLEQAGVRLTPRGHVEVDRVSRTSARGVYAAGDCTGVLPLASVAAMQGRIAMAHALGDAVLPLDLTTVAANIFTAPEIATVGRSQKELEESGVRFVTASLDLARNPRAKMLGIRDGFVKIFAHAATGTVLGGVVVAPRAGELIFPLTLAVAHKLTTDDVAQSFTVYPSLSGSVAEVARILHQRED
ncbi:NAD(P)H-quinone dehydrogenase [Actinotalea sp. K2]|uniref:NAD(P)H-quinone dehydrogenase n=1 Tax=Actinotalea sp. K2 TaxID=2939438 RepID=UPI002017CE57|nr:NAD(P)H-quinone dehydrogenase [Actinotalea sp. K2]MCL3862630.1 NAD(P)H-quinone dehydrogenase [Actinotalea sp. K2]